MIDLTNPAAEAARLESMGVLDVTYKNGGNKERTAKLVCVGYGVDGKEQDVFIFVGPYGMQNKHMTRPIVINDIVDVQVSETQSFDRYNMKGKRQVGRLGSAHGNRRDESDFFEMRTRER